MKYLVFCACGHTVEDHGAGGCGDTSTGACTCRRDQLGALDAAVDRAKTEAVAVWRTPGDRSAAVIA